MPETSTKKISRRQPQPLDYTALGASDTYLVDNVLPRELAESAFNKMREEVKWNAMLHRGGEVPRLVAVEGEVGEDGSIPIYRHPADSSPPLLPFSPTVSKIREEVQKVLKHPINHVLIQHYRTGADYISDHSDKTIDVVRGSYIVNVSLGAQRVMVLRAKRDRTVPDEPPNVPGTESAPTQDGSVPNANAPRPPRDSQRVALPHNSLFVLGPKTNAQWTHGIPTDKRPLHLKSPDEQSEGGERISLTFRWIGTFLSGDPGDKSVPTSSILIWGQGATSQTREEAKPVVCGGQEAEKLLAAFGRENFEGAWGVDGEGWDEVYAGGSDVLHFT